MEVKLNGTTGQRVAYLVEDRKSATVRVGIQDLNKEKFYDLPLR